MKYTTAIALALALSLSACGSMKDMSNAEAVGTTIGVLAGGWLGYQFGQGWGQAAATATGAIIGGTAGYYTGGAVSE